MYAILSKVVYYSCHTLYMLYHYFYILYFFFFFKQKTAYEMRISDWSSDVCSSDLVAGAARRGNRDAHHRNQERQAARGAFRLADHRPGRDGDGDRRRSRGGVGDRAEAVARDPRRDRAGVRRRRRQSGRAHV